MANPRVRRMIQRHRLAQHGVALDEQPTEEEVVRAELNLPPDEPLVEVAVEVGEDEPLKVDEELIENLLEKGKEGEKLSYSEKRKKAIAEKVATKKKEND